MKTNLSIPPADRFMRGFGAIVAIAGVVFLTAAPLASADIPERSPGAFGGIYKVVASSDPIFPATKTTEFFLDFGKGIQAGKSSGSVSISMRKNPNVKVRILAWEYFPEQGSLVIGNPYAEGSRNAVARAVWKMNGVEGGVVFERGRFQLILHRADPNDY